MTFTAPLALPTKRVLLSHPHLVRLRVTPGSSVPGFPREYPLPGHNCRNLGPRLRRRGYATVSLLSSTVGAELRGG